MTTTQSRRKTVTPSPLSQSTSAVHLQPPDAGGIHLPRKLSKRRTPALGSIFGNQANTQDRNAVSLPATPVERIPLSQLSKIPDGPDQPKRMSSVPVAGPEVTMKKEKRGSVLGRLAKKFSLIRKPPQDRERKSDDWQHVSPEDTKGRGSSGFVMTGRQGSPEKSPTDLTKRVPPPLFGGSGAANHSEPANDAEADRASSVSLDAPFSMGRLTIANPDVPGSENTTPVQQEAPLPPEKTPPPLPKDRQSYSTSTPPHDNALSSSPSKSPVLTHPPSTHTSRNALPPTSLPGSQPLVKAPSPSLKPSTSLNGHQRIQLYDTPHRAEKSKTPSPQPTTSSHAHDTNIPIDSRERTMAASPAPTKANSTSHSPLVPFPAADSSDQHTLPNPTYSFASYDNSPLSTSSMLANPPTPYAADRAIPATPEPSRTIEPPIAAQDVTRLSHAPSSGTQTASRQTETFKLIRSSSGNIYASGETIVAAGEQWEVVESLDGRTKGRPASSKSRDRAGSHRREQRREEKTQIEVDPESDRRHRVRSHQSHRQSTEVAPATSARADSPESRPRDETKHSRKRDADRKPTAAIPQTNVNVNKPQPAPPPPTPGPHSSRPLERHPSTSARPTSELASSAEMNALRAKEAWDMERLWKARSMYGTEPNGITPTLIPSPPAKDDEALHGSSHTAFMVQTPFTTQTQSSQIYHSMPTAPPPIIYASTPSLPIAHHTTPPKGYSNTSRSFPNLLSPDQRTLSTTIRSPLANPLPEPPRESTYEPSPLSAVLLDSPSVRSSEYWSKFSGVTTAH